MVSDNASPKVCFRDKTRKLLLALSFTALDPNLTFAAAHNSVRFRGTADNPSWNPYPRGPTGDE
jgi:hypothetical protein